MNHSRLSEEEAQQLMETKAEWETDFDEHWRSTSSWNLHPHNREPVKNFIRTKVRADWLRSEIEKIEIEINKVPTDYVNTNWTPEELREGEIKNSALFPIITRYKEELKVLESK